MLLDFPSLSSLTITSKNEPSFVKEQYSIPSAIDGIKPKKKKRSTLPTWPLVQQLKLILSAIKSSQKQEQPPQKRHHARLLSHYGQLQRRQIGTGASATVLLTHQLQEDGKVVRVYAVKAFRKRKVRETDASFMKKLISEFCISSTLDHPNIVKTVDLVLDDKNRYCTVMEYCSGGDLYSFIKEGRLSSQDEANGYFKQLLDGLSYLHRLGVAHRDIKPENLLLVKHSASTILKISDFGEADVFREAWQESCRLSDGLCGSTPYIAPEIFVCSKQGYRASQADVWSAGIVYFCMRLNGVPFYSAQQSDTNYRLYRKHYAKQAYPAFESFDEESRQMMYAMLNPDPEKRYTIQDVLKLTWLAEVKPPIYE
ncbi:kinase-like domain-containing protein [Mucor lusitanicus]|uniref:Kinase-like domain-containing protein n=2 Tax=Mucor circinelloides f. lusitanicus TaxID=29924 RepID=A0A8H4F0W2_MUCCL|nr:kinase-like domain-containing protein [Mucor lusitanicus]